jgi:hypothetical protein
MDGRPFCPAALPLTMETESGLSGSPNGRLVGLMPLYRSGRRGGDLGIAAARLSASCCARAAAFLLGLSSPLFDRRKRRPSDDLLGGLFFSGIAASLSGGGD